MSDYDPYENLEYFDDYDIEDTQKHHKDLVTKLSKPGEVLLATVTPEKAHLWHMATGVCTEAGELLDCIKKHICYNQELNLENLVEEVGDILFYLQGIMNPLGISLDLCKIHNIAKLEKRYGDTYSDEAAKHRADKTDE